MIVHRLHIRQFFHIHACTRSNGSVNGLSKTIETEGCPILYIEPDFPYPLQIFCLDVPMSQLKRALSDG